MGCVFGRDVGHLHPDDAYYQHNKITPHSAVNSHHKYSIPSRTDLYMNLTGASYDEMSYFPINRKLATGENEHTISIGCRHKKQLRTYCAGCEMPLRQRCEQTYHHYHQTEDIIGSTRASYKELKERCSDDKINFLKKQLYICEHQQAIVEQVSKQQALQTTSNDLNLLPYKKLIDSALKMNESEAPKVSREQIQNKNVDNISMGESCGYIDVKSARANRRDWCQSQIYVDPDETLAKDNENIYMTNQYDLPSSDKKPDGGRTGPSEELKVRPLPLIPSSEQSSPLIEEYSTDNAN